MSLSVAKSGTLIVWIRRELRLADHLALWSAAQDAATVIPLYIIRDDFAKASPSRQHILLDGLAELRSSLRKIGGELVIREGEPERVIHALLLEHDAAGLYCTKSYHAAERLRDRELRSSIEASGKLWREFKDHVLFEEEEILSKSQSAPFTVYTAYKNAWRERQEEIPPSLPPIRSLRVPPMIAGELPRRPAGGPDDDVRPRGGEKVALARLRSFLSRGVAAYHKDRDVPALDGTSRLSHHLASGSLSIRTAYQELVARSAAMRGPGRQGPDAFLNELIWREFYYQILANFPHVARGSFKPAFDRLEWTDNRAHVEAWQRGLTGYPIVDAAMRQLNHEGWMHNRCRMITANFLTKDLHVDWRKGEEYFMLKLADGDVALNNGGWQWSAGTGNDAQPWFRIFNPVLQSKKVDASGTYLRRYIPELAHVPAEYIHEPWRMPEAVQAKAGCRIGRDYPAPIIDHAVERARTLARYGRIAAKRRSEAEKKGRAA